MDFFQLSKDLCKRDNICSDLCPVGIIRLDEDNYPRIPDKLSVVCINCGQCVAFCPHDAWSLESVPSVKIDKSLMPSKESAALFLQSRRSIRKFRKKGLERNEIEAILELAHTAPTATNNNHVRWIVLEQREQLDRCAELVVDFFDELIEKYNESDPQRVAYLKGVVKGHRAGRDVIFRGAPQLVVAVAPDAYEWKTEDGVVALTYLELAAHARGAGMCWAGFLTRAARYYKPLKEYIGINDDEYICGAQMLGIPALGIPKRIPHKHDVKVTYL